MASGIRSIVWRSDIDAGRERPAFFFVAGKAQLVDSAGGTARSPANPANPSFSGRERVREKGREGGERGQEEGGWEVIC